MNKDFFKIDHKITLLDTREKSEFKKGHISNAILFDINSLFGIGFGLTGISIVFPFDFV